jgi:hypothetical protein
MVGWRLRKTLRMLALAGLLGCGGRTQTEQTEHGYAGPWSPSADAAVLDTYGPPAYGGGPEDSSGSLLPSDAAATDAGLVDDAADAAFVLDGGGFAPEAGRPDATTINVGWQTGFDGGPTLLAYKGVSIDCMALDATYLYWGQSSAQSPVVRSGLIAKMPRTGGSPTVIATLPAPLYAVGIAIDGSNAYFTLSTARPMVPDVPEGAVMKVPLSGGTPTMLAPSPSPGPLALASGVLYWVDRGTGPDGRVQKVGVDGSAITTLAQTNYPRLIGVDATDVFWTAEADSGPNGAWLYTVPIGGGMPNLVGFPAGNLVASGVRGLAVDATGAYTTATFTPVPPGTSPPGNWDLYRIAAGAGVPGLLAGGPGRFSDIAPSAIAVAAGNVYWHRGDGVLWSLPITGGTPTLVDSHFGVTMIVGDSTGLYGPIPCAFAPMAQCGAIVVHRLP